LFYPVISFKTVLDMVLECTCIATTDSAARTLAVKAATSPATSISTIRDLAAALFLAGDVGSQQPPYGKAGRIIHGIVYPGSSRQLSDRFWQFQGDLR
jgi:hypothetical protein